MESEKFDSYQDAARESSWHPHGDTTGHEMEDAAFYALALCGETGEIANRIKKVLRGDVALYDPDVIDGIVDEAGDALWYLARLADTIGISLSTVAALNIAKIRTRKLENQDRRNS